MTWIALADHSDQRFSARGIGAAATAPRVLDDDPNALLARGSVVLETRLSPTDKPQTLFEFRRRDPLLCALTIRAIPGGGISLVIEQGTDLLHSAVHQIAPGRTDTLRITYAWDAPRRWARFSVERPESALPQISHVANPVPFTVADIRALALDPTARRMSPDLIYLAISDQVEAIGPMPTLFPNVPILTPQGYRDAGDLRRGDSVSTLSSGVVPVLHTIRRTVPARGSFRPVHLRAPYFGLTRDIITAPDQRLVISGSEVEYTFGRESVLVPACYLTNGTAAYHQPETLMATYVQVILPGHETLIAAGSAVESLYVGRLRRKTDLLEATLLADIDRATLPEHGQVAHPVLRPFEAITLAEQRAA